MAKEPFLGLKGSALTWGITLCTASCYLLYGKHKLDDKSIILTEVG